MFVRNQSFRPPSTAGKRTDKISGLSLQRDVADIKLNSSFNPTISTLNGFLFEHLHLAKVVESITSHGCFVYPALSNSWNLCPLRINLS